MFLITTIILFIVSLILITIILNKNDEIDSLKRKKPEIIEVPVKRDIQQLVEGHEYFLIQKDIAPIKATFTHYDIDHIPAFKNENGVFYNLGYSVPVNYSNSKLIKNNHPNDLFYFKKSQ
jgi:hypothetical protein